MLEWVPLLFPRLSHRCFQLLRFLYDIDPSPTDLELIRQTLLQIGNTCIQAIARDARRMIVI